MYTINTHYISITNKYWWHILLSLLQLGTIRKLFKDCINNIQIYIPRGGENGGTSAY